MNEYKPGDVANGHVLTDGGAWAPLPADHPAVVEAEVARRTYNAKSNAWMLWLFLGGFNGHLAYLYPKRAGLWIGCTVAAFFICAIFTLGFGLLMWPLLWLLNWMPLLSEQTFDARRAYVREQIESDLLRQRALYGRA